MCTGFVEFIICLKNIYDLAYYLLHNKYIDYLLSYKLSQDHIEMFFSLIRRMNGFNNNPTTIQYLSAIQKLLSNRLNVCISSSANCAPLDNTLLVTIDNTSKNESVKPNGCFNVTNENETSEILENCISANKNQCTFDHEYCTMDGSWSNSEYRDEIIAYISGSIVHYLKRSIHCTDCLKLIDGSSNCDKTPKLIVLKNRGGLNFAADWVIVICKNTERVIREQKNLFDKKIVSIIISETLTNLPCDILNDKHFLEQDPLLSHRNQLLTLIIKKYINIRFLHESRLMNDKVNRIRMKNNSYLILRPMITFSICLFTIYQSFVIK